MLEGCSTLVSNPGCADLEIQSVLADHGLHADCAGLYRCKSCKGFMILDVYDADDVWVGHIEVNTHLGLFEFEYHAF
jgi:hypothetical protein